MGPRPAARGPARPPLSPSCREPAVSGGSFAIRRGRGGVPIGCPDGRPG
jgi:hypothetical protein